MEFVSGKHALPEVANIGCAETLKGTHASNSQNEPEVQYISTPEKAFPCSVMGDEHDSTGARTSSATVHTQGNSAPQCTECGKVFSWKGHLIRHTRSVHQNIRDFFCQVERCSKAFKSKWALTEHHSTKHSTDRKFVCSICGKKFAVKRIGMKKGDTVSLRMGQMLVRISQQPKLKRTRETSS